MRPELVDGNRLQTCGLDSNHRIRTADTSSCQMVAQLPKNESSMGDQLQSKLKKNSGFRAGNI